jgi:hypothetical protein
MNNLGRRSVWLWFALLAVVPGLTLAVEQSTKGGAVVISDSVKAKATITKVDQKSREITLRGEHGNEFVVVAGDEVRNFKQIKKGDIVEVEYHVAAATRLEKAEAATAAGEATVVERAPAGAKPGVAAMHTSTIVATVVDIDPAQRLLSLRGPKGNVATLKIPPDLKAFDQLKKGDRVTAAYTEAVAISVNKPTKKK